MEIRVCPEICHTLCAFRVTARCDINNSFIVDVSAAFTSQICDDAVELFRLIVRKPFSSAVVRVLLIGLDLENEATANLSPNAGADVLK